MDDLSREDAFVGLLLAAVWIDGRERLEELGVVRGALENVALLQRVGERGLPALVAASLERFKEHGSQALLDACAERLDEDHRLQAFTLAVDILLADRNVHRDEYSHFKRMREALGVSEERCWTIVAVLETKHATRLAPPIEPSVSPGQRPSKREALAAFPLAALRATGRTSERGPRMNGAVPPLPKLGPDERTHLVALVERRVNQEGRAPYLRHCALALEDGERLQAFTWAADVLMDDLQLDEAEEAFLHDARDALRIEASEAARILDVMWAKHLR